MSPTASGPWCVRQPATATLVLSIHFMRRTSAYCRALALVMQVSSLYLRQALDGHQHHQALLDTLDTLSKVDPRHRMYYRDESMPLFMLAR